MSNLSVDLKGKVAVVTGGGNGIGRACALALAKSGAAVAVVDISDEALEGIKAEIENAGRVCRTYKCDVTKNEQINTMMDDIENHFGHIDILLNSAGINIQQYAEDVTEEAWDRIIDINLRGTFFCCQAAGRKMIAQGQGKIINISSTMSMVGLHRRTAYCASKGAVMQMSKVLAVEWATKNVQVNCVAPTFVNTPFTEPMFKEKAFYDEVVSRIPMGKVGETSDVIGAVLYLSSDAADFVTGSTLLVDGGWTAW